MYEEKSIQMNQLFLRLMNTPFTKSLNEWMDERRGSRGIKVYKV